MSVVVVLRVHPGARKTGIVGLVGQTPKLAVTAPPVDGAANEAACKAVADIFAVKPRAVRLIGGARSRTKRFEIDGVTDAQLTDWLEALNDRHVDG